MFSSATKLNIPNIHNLLTDPKELYPDRTGETTWVLPPVLKRVVAHQATLFEEPPIPEGTPDPYVSE